MPSDAHPNPLPSKLDRALVVAAAVVERYEGTAFEEDAIRIFERIESEHAAQVRKIAAKKRAQSLLATSPVKCRAPLNRPGGFFEPSKVGSRRSIGYTSKQC